MTRASPPDYTLEDFYASRHPIRRFVAVLIVTTLALILVWWTGLLAPRLSSDLSNGHFDPVLHHGVLELDVRNTSPTPVRVHGVDAPSSAAIRSATLDGQQLKSRPKISGGGTAVLHIEYQADVCIADSQAGVVSLRLDVRTVAGITRTEHLHAVFPRSASPTIPC